MLLTSWNLKASQLGTRHRWSKPGRVIQIDVFSHHDKVWKIQARQGSHNSKLEFEDASHGDCPPGDRRERGVVSVDLKGPSKFAEKKWCTQTRSSINALPAVDFRWISDPEVKDDAPQWCKEYNRNIVISWLGTGVSHRSISRSESKNPHVSRHRDFGKLRVGKGSFMWEVMLIFWRQDSQPQLRVFENGLWLIFWLDGTRCTSINGSCGMGIDPTNDVEHFEQWYWTVPCPSATK